MMHARGTLVSEKNKADSGPKRESTERQTTDL